jgi:hypothetical protein
VGQKIITAQIIPLIIIHYKALSLIVHLIIIWWKVIDITTILTEFVFGPHPTIYLIIVVSQIIETGAVISFPHQITI